MPLLIIRYIWQCRPILMILSLLNSKVNVYSQVMILNDWDTKWLHCALAAAQCIVIGPICLWGRGVVCYHDNSKLHASILTKLGLLVKVVTISSWLNFWPPRAPGKVVCGGAKIFGSALLQPARSVCVSSERFFHFLLQWQKSKSAIKWFEIKI